jgi:hypothetical protein
MPFQMMTIFVDVESLLPEEKRKGRFASMVELPYCAFLAFLTYMIFRILDKYKPFATDAVGVSTKHIWLFTALMVVLLISWPSARLYRLILIKLQITPTD